MIVEMANYLSGCPALRGRQVCVNYLGDGDGSVSLEVASSRENIKGYADGAVMRGITFILVLRDGFALSQSQNTEIARMCEEIEGWVEEQNLKGLLPDLLDGAQAISVGIARCFKIAQTRDFSARYEAQIELIYYV